MDARSLYFQSGYVSESKCEVYIIQIIQAIDNVMKRYSENANRQPRAAAPVASASGNQ